MNKVLLLAGVVLSLIGSPAAAIVDTYLWCKVSSEDTTVTVSGDKYLLRQNAEVTLIFGHVGSAECFPPVSVVLQTGQSIYACAMKFGDNHNAPKDTVVRERETAIWMHYPSDTMNEPLKIELECSNKRET